MASRTRRLLLVEDEPADRALLTRCLARSPLAQYFVDTAATLDEGLARAQAGSFDAVLLDLCLPDSQGPATVSRFTQVSSAPVIALSGAGGASLDRAVRERGAHRFVLKDWDSLRTLDRMLEDMLQACPSDSAVGA